MIFLELCAYLALAMLVGFFIARTGSTKPLGTIPERLVGLQAMNVPLIVARNYRHKGSGRLHRLIAVLHDSIIPGEPEEAVTVTIPLMDEPTESWIGQKSDFMKEFVLV